MKSERKAKNYSSKSTLRTEYEVQQTTVYEMQRPQLFKSLNYYH